MNAHKLMELADKCGRTKTMIKVIMENKGTYTAMREVDACLKLAEKYPKLFSASQVTMFEVRFIILEK